MSLDHLHPIQVFQEVKIEKARSHPGDPEVKAEIGIQNRGKFIFP